MSEYTKRKYIRYPAEPNEIVTIDYLDESTKKPRQLVGIAQDESFKGSCVVFVGEVSFKKGQEVLCECNKLPKVKAKVVWTKKLENHIIMAGFSMIE